MCVSRGEGESRQTRFSALGAKIFFLLQACSQKSFMLQYSETLLLRTRRADAEIRLFPASSVKDVSPFGIWQVFFSAYIFNSNVMVKVATQPADNPLDVLSRKLHLGPNVGRDVPRLSLPGKLVFPR